LPVRGSGRVPPRDVGVTDEMHGPWSALGGIDWICTDGAEVDRHRPQKRADVSPRKVLRPAVWPPADFAAESHDSIAEDLDSGAGGEVGRVLFAPGIWRETEIPFARAIPTLHEERMFRFEGRIGERPRRRHGSQAGLIRRKDEDGKSEPALAHDRECV